MAPPIVIGEKINNLFQIFCFTSKQKQSGCNYLNLNQLDAAIIKLLKTLSLYKF